MRREMTRRMVWLVAAAGVVSGLWWWGHRRSSSLEVGRPVTILTPMAGQVARVGEWAPDFTLVSPDGQRLMTLSDLYHRRPVVLIFGSFT